MDRCVREPVELFVTQMKQLPAMPEVLRRILELVEDEYSTLEELERAVLGDQSITAKVLQLANSAYYGAPRRIATVSRALVIIGAEQMRNIALSVSVFEAFTRGNGKAVAAVLDVWRHSIDVAHGARMLARFSPDAHPEEAFIGGLLHDIGKMVFLHCDYVEYERMLSGGAVHGLPLLEAERRTLETTHPEVGEVLGITWHFPASLISCINSHHVPEQVVEQRDLVECVTLANWLALFKPTEPIPTDDAPACTEVLIPDGAQAALLREEMARAAADTKSAFGIT